MYLIYDIRQCQTAVMFENGFGVQELMPYQVNDGIFQFIDPPPKGDKPLCLSLQLRDGKLTVNTHLPHDLSAKLSTHVFNGVGVKENGWS